MLYIHSCLYIIARPSLWLFFYICNYGSDHRWLVFFSLFWGQRLSSDAPKVPERLLACKKVDVRLNDFPKKLQTMSPEQALQGCSAIARFPLCLWCTLLEESMGKRVGASFCASVFCWATFPVTPLPERLRGGNTAAGCPCPSLFLSLFSSCSPSLMFPLVSRVPSSPPFPPQLCLSLLSWLRALLWYRTPTEEQG